MSPHPVKDVDMERKEELILAKQLRAARVTILPKSPTRLIPPSFIQPPAQPPQVRRKTVHVINHAPSPSSSSSVSPVSPSPRSVAKAQNPVALRYWNQCLSLAQQPEMEKSHDLEKSVISNNNDPVFPPPIQVEKAVKKAPTSNGKLVFSVPNINKQIMRPNDSIKMHCSKNDWTSILAEDEAHNKKVQGSLPKYPWMKNGQKETPKVTEKTDGNNNEIIRDGKVSYSDSARPPANPEDMDLRLCFTKLPSSVKKDITFHHLASLHSSEIQSSFEYIKEKVFVTALLEFLPKLSTSAKSSLRETLGMPKESNTLGDSICVRCAGKSQESEKKVESDGDGMEIVSQDNEFLDESLQGEKTDTETASENEQNNNIDEDLHNTTGEKMSFEDLDRGQSDIHKMDHDNSDCRDDDGAVNTEQEVNGTNRDQSGKPDANTDDVNNNEDDCVDGGNEAEEEEAEEEEWEWDDSDDYEYEYLEMDEDQYKVQTFDGSFSIAI